MSGLDVMELVNMGYRMDKPKLCSELMWVYSFLIIMSLLFNFNPDHSEQWETLININALLPNVKW